MIALASIAKGQASKSQQIAPLEKFPPHPTEER